MIRLPTHRPPTPPGTFLLHDYLEPLGMTQRELAVRLAITPAHANELIHAKRSVTPETALRLEKLFGTSAQFWLNAQLAWDLWHALRSPKIKRVVAKITAAGGLRATSAIPAERRSTVRGLRRA